jgi:hypothetical protein
LPILHAECPHSPSPRPPSDKIEGVSCAVGTNAEVPEVGATSVVTWCFHVLAILNVDVITSADSEALACRCLSFDPKSVAFLDRYAVLPQIVTLGHLRDSPRV